MSAIRRRLAGPGQEAAISARLRQQLDEEFEQRLAQAQRQLDEERTALGHERDAAREKEQLLAEQARQFGEQLAAQQAKLLEHEQLLAKQAEQLVLEQAAAADQQQRANQEQATIAATQVAVEKLSASLALRERTLVEQETQFARRDTHNESEVGRLQAELEASGAQIRRLQEATETLEATRRELAEANAREANSEEQRAQLVAKGSEQESIRAALETKLLASQGTAQGLQVQLNDLQTTYRSEVASHGQNEAAFGQKNVELSQALTNARAALEALRAEFAAERQQWQTKAAAEAVEFANQRRLAGEANAKAQRELDAANQGRRTVSAELESAKKQLNDLKHASTSAEELARGRAALHDEKSRLVADLASKEGKLSEERRQLESERQAMKEAGERLRLEALNLDAQTASASQTEAEARKRLQHERIDLDQARAAFAETRQAFQGETQAVAASQEALSGQLRDERAAIEAQRRAQEQTWTQTQLERVALDKDRTLLQTLREAFEEQRKIFDTRSTDQLEARQKKQLEDAQQQLDALRAKAVNDEHTTKALLAEMRQLREETLALKKEMHGPDPVAEPPVNEQRAPTPIALVPSPESFFESGEPYEPEEREEEDRPVRLIAGRTRMMRIGVAAALLLAITVILVRIVGHPTAASEANAADPNLVQAASAPPGTTAANSPSSSPVTDLHDEHGGAPGSPSVDREPNLVAPHHGQSPPSKRARRSSDDLFDAVFRQQ